MKLDIDVGEPLRGDGIDLFPLFGQESVIAHYELARDALNRGDVAVEEVNAGAIPQALAHNRTPTPVLFFEAEELTGAKQNRMLATDMLLEGGQTRIIPVACIEQGRWSQTSRTFGASGLIASPRLRYALKASVARSLRARWGHRADQVSVWHQIESLHARLEVPSKTFSWSDAAIHYRERAASFLQHFPYVDHALGVAVAMQGRVCVADWFGRRKTCQRLWPQLVTAAAMEIFERRPSPAKATRVDVESFLERLASVPQWNANAVGLGIERRVGNGGDLHGLVLQDDDQTIHGSLIDGAALAYLS